MRTGIESFVSLFMLCVVIMIASFFVTSSMAETNARDYHATIVSAVEASNGAEQVINKCKAEAKKAGYDVEIKSANIVEDKYYYYVTLKYEYHVPLVGSLVTNTIEGYAR